MSDSSSTPLSTALHRPRPSTSSSFRAPGRAHASTSAASFFITVLFVGLVWGVREILHLNAPRPATGANINRPDPTPVPPTSPDPEADDGSLPGRRAHALLRTRVERFRDGKAELTELDQVVAHQTVTVVNLWATWCGPCKSELPGFRELFARNPACSRDTRFVALMVDDPVPGSSAHRRFNADMPPLPTPSSSTVTSATRSAAPSRPSTSSLRTRPSRSPSYLTADGGSAGIASAPSMSPYLPPSVPRSTHSAPISASQSR